MNSIQVAKGRGVDQKTDDRFFALTGKYGWIAVEKAPHGWSGYLTIPGKYAISDGDILDRMPMPSGGAGASAHVEQGVAVEIVDQPLFVHDTWHVMVKCLTDISLGDAFNTSAPQSLHSGEKSELERTVALEVVEIHGHGGVHSNWPRGEAGRLVLRGDGECMRKLDILRGSRKASNK
jgi:hypothetical protein